jgi:H+-transporting ATPase
MRLVLSIATVLGVIGVVAAFGLFYLAERVFHMDRLQAQTLMYLKLSVAGHLTIFLTRTRGPFWSIRPAKILWMAVLGTQTIATLIAVYGLFMTPLGWKWAGFVWGYAIAWALINDRIKLLAYKIFDPVKAEAKPEAKAVAKPGAKSQAKTEEPKPDPVTKADAKPEIKSEPKVEAKSEAKPVAKVEAKSEAKAPSELKPQIALRAYELYEERDHHDGTAAQDWQKAEGEIRKVGANGQPKPEAKTDEPKPEVKTEPKPEAKTEPKPEAKDKPQPDATPQLVKRVHELYEELGREDVQSVQDWEKAHPELEEQESHK